MRRLWHYYNLNRYAAAVVYMLQNVEYQAIPYLKWYWRTQDFGRVMYRRQLDRTRAARLLDVSLLVGMGLQLALALFVVGRGVASGHGDTPSLYFGLALLVSYPFVWGHLVLLPLVLGRWLIVQPRQRRAVAAAEQIFLQHHGHKIAVAGSYGKSTMKELLVTVLSEGLDVAATPANMNVASSHARFAHGLTGKEDVLVIEYGEGRPGDVARFAENTHPTHGIITGVAPAHLDQYKTVRAAAEDIFSLADYLKGGFVYVNAESPSAQPFMQPRYHRYDVAGALGWKVKDVQVDFEGTSFTLSKGKHSLKLHSGLVGRHQVGPLSLVAALALELGLTGKQVIAGVAKTVSFEHRMKPYRLGHAWIIDDTYNGNIEGVRAGTELLRELPGERKWYVTPGLVDQGVETAAVHYEMGQLIAAAKPDVVVLMQNSVTDTIQQGLTAAKFTGEVRVETDPLAFYTHLEHQLASGDVVLMQNDWTDNYA